MDPNRSIKLRWLHGMLHDVTSELARLQFSRIGAHTWQPAVNAYRCDKCIRVCVDLAGVERSRIDLTVESDRLVLRGVRDVPEPTHAEGRAVQLLAMEIDYGPFEREVRLPESPCKKALMQNRRHQMRLQWEVPPRHRRPKFPTCSPFCRCAALLFFQGRFFP